MVIDPERARRRARILRPLGILTTVVGAALLLGGIVLITMNPFEAFDFFFLPFIGGFLVFPGILMWVAGNLSRASADYASRHPGFGQMPGAPPGAFGVSATRSCPSCGNANPMGASTCQVCGSKLA